MAGDTGLRAGTDGGVPLGSFGADLNVVVVGASGGIGRALTNILTPNAAVTRIIACSRSGLVPEHFKVRHQSLDLEDEATIANAAEAAQADAAALDLVIVASGILHAGDALHPEKTWRALDGAALEQVYRINTVGPALVAKHFLPLLARDRKSVFAALSARVGSISDNQLGGWHAYRASKAALNMLVRTFAIELARRNPACDLRRSSPGHGRHGTVGTVSGQRSRGQTVHPRLRCRASAGSGRPPHARGQRQRVRLGWPAHPRLGSVACIERCVQRVLAARRTNCIATPSPCVTMCCAVRPGARRDRETGPTT